MFIYAAEDRKLVNLDFVREIGIARRMDDKVAVVLGGRNGPVATIHTFDSVEAARALVRHIVWDMQVHGAIVNLPVEFGPDAS